MTPNKDGVQETVSADDANSYGLIGSRPLQRIVRIAERLSKEGNFAGVAVCSIAFDIANGDAVSTACG